MSDWLKLEIDRLEQEENETLEEVINYPLPSAAPATRNTPQFTHTFDGYTWNTVELVRYLERINEALAEVRTSVGELRINNRGR